MNEANGFNILTVCTGNLVRSAVGAQLLRSRLRELGGAVVVSSAGTAAMKTDEMPPEAVAISVHYGGDPHGHRAQLLTTDIVAEADLVLTATREQRAQVVSLMPRASRITFTFNQFARLVDSIKISDTGFSDPGTAAGDVLRRVVEEAAAERGYLPPLADPALDDIDDPYQQELSAYQRAGIEIDSSTARISTVLLKAASLARLTGASATNGS